MTQISIITPAYIDTYQKLNWIEEMLQSVQSQSLTDWEVIIIDDNSPIAMAPLMNQYKSPKFRWFRTPKKSGPALVRNTAVELATGEAILPIDADDLLADENALTVLYTEWQNDKSKFYYGNLDLMNEQNGSFQRKRFKPLLDYTFKASLNKNGIMPVSCMFSYDLWKAAGGWKPELEAGREDVEFWISAGKAGHCGQKVNHYTLVYRKHSTSRDYALTNITKRTGEMWNKIQMIHQDIFEGRYPVGCCGGGRGYTPPQNGQTKSSPSTLDGYSENEKIWIEYAGNRQGGFGVNGSFTSYTYRVNGPGHKLQVHTNDLARFRMAGRGQDFIIGTSPPIDHNPPKEQIGKYIPPDPVLAQIERLDEIAAAAQNG